MNHIDQLIEKRDQLEAELMGMQDRIAKARAAGNDVIVEIHLDTYEWMKRRIAYLNKQIGV